MACNITLNGLSLECSNVGGLKALYITPIESVSGITVSTGVTGESITAITMVSTAKFKQFNFKNNNANFVSTPTVADSAGTRYQTTVTTVTFNRQETLKRAEMEALMSTPTYIIVKDWNDVYHFIGYNSYNYCAVTAQSGAAKGDANNYSLVATCETPILPYTVASAAVLAVI
jgi:hypothetical protein